MNKILCGDARVLAKELKDESVDLIFTDPPYLTEYLYTYDWLAEIAERVLKPGGRVVCYSGHYHLDYVFKAFAKTKLNYYFTFNSINLGMGSVIWKRNIVSRTKSLVMYTKGFYKPRHRVMSCYTGRKDKKYHAWGQSAEEARYYIESLSNPGELVLDPFAGGGTIPYVCQRIGRDWIAYEVDEKHCAVANKRLSEPYQEEWKELLYVQNMIEL